jgi:hypothetical protein
MASNLIKKAGCGFVLPRLGPRLASHDATDWSFKSGRAGASGVFLNCVRLSAMILVDSKAAGGGAGATAGGWSKMSDEPLAREREPIERVRARLEALVRANAAPRCGARSKRTGKPCRAAAMPNGRCKVHGGKSTGPRTPEGLERSRRANWKHGYYSREAKAERSRVRAAAILALRYLRMLGH